MKRDDNEALVRAAIAMIRNHGDDAERKAQERADHLERDGGDSAHWREVARVVRRLRTRPQPDG
jgi:hypothetical protein